MMLVNSGKAQLFALVALGVLGPAPFAHANINDPAIYDRAEADPEGFWAGAAGSLDWFKPWDKVLEWNFSEPKNNWFIGGKLNITENCLDRHLAERGDQTAILWEPNNPHEPGRKTSEPRARTCGE